MKHLRRDAGLPTEVEATDVRTSTWDIRSSFTAFMGAGLSVWPPFDPVANNGVLKIAQEVENRDVLEPALCTELHTRIIQQSHDAKHATINTRIQFVFFTHDKAL
ncbi:hypothetical protein D9M69_348790 [compost metagenome]